MVSFSKDGKKIVSGDYDKTLKIWNNYNYNNIDNYASELIISPSHSDFSCRNCRFDPEAISCT